MPVITFPFTNTANYVKVQTEVADGKSRTVITTNPSQTFTEDFANDTGFTYDNTKVEFSGGQMQQKKQNTTITFAADYTVDEDATYSDGSGTGALSGSPLPTVDSGYLKFSNVLGQDCDYSAVNNADSLQVGAYKFKITPQYSGAPAASMPIIGTSKDSTTTFNGIILVHSAGTAQLSLFLSDQNNVVTNTNLGAWSPTSGTEYEFESR